MTLHRVLIDGESTTPIFDPKVTRQLLLAGRQKMAPGMIVQHELRSPQEAPFTKDEPWNP